MDIEVVSHVLRLQTVLQQITLCTCSCVAEGMSLEQPPRNEMWI
jgi:hypothetical protein